VFEKAGINPPPTTKPALNPSSTGVKSSNHYSNIEKPLINLAHLHSFAMPYQATKLCAFNNAKDLIEAAREFELFNKPHFILGGGTNTIFTSDLDGTVIQLNSSQLKVEQDNEFYYLNVDAGYHWHDLVKWSLDNKIYGLENLALIPGNVGAAPIQNIGAYGLELADICHYVEYIDKQSLELIRLRADELLFGYRDSIFKNRLKDKVVITTVGLKLAKQWQSTVTYAGLAETQTAQEIFDAVVNLRRLKLPDHRTIPNAGSFFKNPICHNCIADALAVNHQSMPWYVVDAEHKKTSAAWLIESCGLKGHCLGGVSIYQKHALILVNENQGVAEQLIELIELVQQSVITKFGIVLEPEVQLIGSVQPKELI
jgi:UDP-N-acetylmuramate dehydrogenase